MYWRYGAKSGPLRVFSQPLSESALKRSHPYE
jgi:hypothetical protein